MHACMCVCVCVGTHVCVRARARACARVCMFTACVHVHELLSSVFVKTRYAKVEEIEQRGTGVAAAERKDNARSNATDKH